MKTVLFCEMFSSIHVHNEINEDLAILISKTENHMGVLYMYILNVFVVQTVRAPC